MARYPYMPVNLEIGKEICEKVAEQGSLIAICLANKGVYPSQTVFNRWVRENEELADLYHGAQKAYATKLVFEAKSIVDGEDHRVMAGGEYNHHQAALMQKQRLWMAERMDNHAWAGTQKLQHTGKDGAPLPGTAHTMTDEELVAVVRNRLGKDDGKA